MKKKKQNKKKKLNSSGFTLIELLAVITIMGILMMVAIPAVSRTIENSRRDSFATVAQNYINAVRNAVLADELSCGNPQVNVSAVESDKVYYLEINSSTAGSNSKAQQTADLMESGGNSPWGGAAVEGFVKWEKGGSSHNGQWEYQITLVDTGKHGISSYTRDQQIKRAQVSVNGATNAGKPSGGVECVYTG